ncbi:hypothetical protein K8R33_02490 [archaeon]|nr:hypothetical protein [archaeon]
MKKVFYILIILVVFVLFYIGGYTFTSYSEEMGPGNYTYVGARGTFEFVKSEQGDHWVTWPVKTLITGNVYNVQDWITPFPYGPYELVDIPMGSNPVTPRVYIRGVKNAETAYITRDVYLDEKYYEDYPKGGLVIAVISLERVIDKLGPEVGVEAIITSIEDNEISRGLDLSVKTCEDASREEIVFWLKEGDTTQIYYDEDNRYCVILEFKEGEDPNRVVTKLAYNIIGVM